jgi:hypothetical protein
LDRVGKRSARRFAVDFCGRGIGNRMRVALDALDQRTRVASKLISNRTAALHANVASGG